MVKLLPCIPCRKNVVSGEGDRESDSDKPRRVQNELSNWVMGQKQRKDALKKDEPLSAATACVDTDKFGSFFH